ncbi:MAG: Lrp/AsnC family transcriptional regulator [Evtepia sp.]
MDHVKLLQLLEKDCTLTTAQLAGMMSERESVIIDAIHDLEVEKEILGYKAIVDWDKTEHEAVTALIEVNVTPQRGEGFDRLAERIVQYDEVESMYLMSGGFDFTVILSGRTLTEVARFVGEKLAPLDGVTKTSTHFILKKYKEKHLMFKTAEKQEEGFVFV